VYLFPRTPSHQVSSFNEFQQIPWKGKRKIRKKKLPIAVKVHFSTLYWGDYSNPPHPSHIYSNFSGLNLRDFFYHKELGLKWLVPFPRFHLFMSRVILFFLIFLGLMGYPNSLLELEMTMCSNLNSYFLKQYRTSKRFARYKQRSGLDYKENSSFFHWMNFTEITKTMYFGPKAENCQHECELMLACLAIKK
jgi:hypothetical protein